MPTSAPSRCNEPGCGDIALSKGRCGIHQRPAWNSPRGSAMDRYGQTGWDRQALHKSVLKDAGYICYYCGGAGADTVDHIVEVADGGSKTARGNLGAIHQEPCHVDKTLIARRARNERRRLAREQSH